MQIWIATILIVLCFLGPNTAWSDTTAKAPATCLACLGGVMPSMPPTVTEETRSKSLGSPQETPNQSTNAVSTATNGPSEAEVANQLFNVFSQSKYNLHNCGNFADENAFRLWGKHILKTMTPEKHPKLFEGPNDLVKVCPSYRSLGDDGKKAVWTLVLAGMAFYESSCRETLPEKRGPHGTLLGMFQLHKGKEQNYYTGGSCKKGDGAKALTSISCVLSMLDILTERNEALFARRSYWAVLRPQDRAKRHANIQQSLRQFPLCKI